MRPILPIAGVVLLTAAAVSLPALTQAKTQYHWKKANIDTSAMSSSMLAENPNAFQPSTTDQQPGAIAPAGQTTDTAMQPSSAKDQATTTGAKHKTKHSKKTKAKAKTDDSSTTNSTSTTMPAAPSDSNLTPGSINSGTASSSAQGMMGNSATTGANSSPTASPTMAPDDMSATAPDKSTMPAPMSSSTSPSK